MSIQRQALIIIEQLRRFGITAPAQQVALLCIYEKPGITYAELMNIMKMGKNSIDGLVKALREWGVIDYTRPNKGQVRTGYMKINEIGKKLLTI